MDNKHCMKLPMKCQILNILFCFIVVITRQMLVMESPYVSRNEQEPVDFTNEMKKGHSGK